MNKQLNSCVSLMLDHLDYAFGGRSQVPIECLGQAIAGNLNNGSWATIGTLAEIVHTALIIFLEDDSGTDSEWFDMYARIAKSATETLHKYGIDPKVYPRKKAGE